jgi:uncharacterized membrane protein
MKELPVSMAVILLLTACGGQESATDLAASNIAAISSTQIIRTDDAPPSAASYEGRQDPAPAPNRPLLANVLAQPSSETRYRALGTEPFWAVTVEGSVATLERPDKGPMRFSISRDDDGRALRYLADGFTMTATEGPCSDGMSDAVWSDRVTLAFGEGTLKGCGGVREDF